MVRPGCGRLETSSINRRFKSCAQNRREKWQVPVAVRSATLSNVRVTNNVRIRLASCTDITRKIKAEHDVQRAELERKASRELDLARQPQTEELGIERQNEADARQRYEQVRAEADELESLAEEQLLAVNAAKSRIEELKKTQSQLLRQQHDLEQKCTDLQNRLALVRTTKQQKTRLLQQEWNEKVRFWPGFSVTRLALT